MSEKSEKIETFISALTTFISENFRNSWFFLTILTYKIFEMKKFLKIGIYSRNFPNFLVISENFWQILV